MKRLLTTLTLVTLCSLTAVAQTDTPKVDVFAGYAFGSLDADIDRLTAHGFGISLTGNLNKWLGITGEYSYGRGNLDFQIGNTRIDTNVNVNLFMAGPRLHARSERVTGFVHALFGGANSSASVSAPGVSASTRGTNFAMAFGGGADINLSEKFAVRIIQADYIPVRADGDWFSNGRVMAGVVFRF
ncbi:MAG: porin family protein [Acidobacteria bacterium]|nr:porin family protein [Acidobacteriota bacterium]MCW5970507.1 porin family protein [Blastocatellales bacterium]